MSKSSQHFRRNQNGSIEQSHNDFAVQLMHLLVGINRNTRITAWKRH